MRSLRRRWVSQANPHSPLQLVGSRCRLCGFAARVEPAGLQIGPHHLHPGYTPQQQGAANRKTRSTYTPACACVSVLACLLLSPPATLFADLSSDSPAYSILLYLFLQDFSSHRIFEHIYEVLNIANKITNYTIYL